MLYLMIVQSTNHQASVISVNIDPSIVIVHRWSVHILLQTVDFAQSISTAAFEMLKIYNSIFESPKSDTDSPIYTPINHNRRYVHQNPTQLLATFLVCITGACGRAHR